MIAYKFLGAGARGLFSDRSWPLPAAEPGAWLEASGPLDPCRNGVHACEPVDLPYWIAEELWEVELDAEQIHGPQSIVARRGRLLRRIDAWNSATARSFAAQCRARAEAFVTTLPVELHEQASQFLETASTTYDAGNFAVTAYACAMVFTLQAQSAAAAFEAERAEQGRLLQLLLNL